MRDFQTPGRSLAVGSNGAAATSHPLSTYAAIEVLRNRGNAVDAALTACSLQSVLEPHNTGLGGIVLRSSGAMTCANFTPSTAPGGPRRRLVQSFYSRPESRR